MGEVVRFPNASTAAGEVFVDALPDDGGSWGIFHESRDRKSVACLGTRFSFDDAFAEAERFAKDAGAFFDCGIGGAA